MMCSSSKPPFDRSNYLNPGDQIAWLLLDPFVRFPGSPPYFVYTETEDKHG